MFVFHFLGRPESITPKCVSLMKEKEELGLNYYAPKKRKAIASAANKGPSHPFNFSFSAKKNTAIRLDAKTMPKLLRAYTTELSSVGTARANKIK